MLITYHVHLISWLLCSLRENQAINLLYQFERQNSAKERQRTCPCNLPKAIISLPFSSVSSEFKEESIN